MSMIQKLLLLAFSLTIFNNIIAQYGSKKKVYDAFVIVNEELETTRENLSTNNNKMHFLVVKANMADSLKYSIPYSKLDSIKSETTTLIKHINNLKMLLIAKSESLKKEEVYANDTIISLQHIKNFDDYNTPSYVLIGEYRWEPIGGQYSAKELKEKLEGYNSFINRINTFLTHYFF